MLKRDILGRFETGYVPWNKGKEHLKGDLHPMWGKTHSNETKKKISEAHTGKPLSQEHKQKLSVAHTGKKLSEETKKKIGAANSKSLKGHIPWNKGKRGHCSKETILKMSVAKKGKPSWNKGKKLSPDHIKKVSGANHPSWQGGISFSPYCHKFNNVLKEQIRDRDDRTCQLCGAKENMLKLSVHHIHYDKENCEPDLIALCRGCNSKVNFNRDYYEDLFMHNLQDRGHYHGVL